MAYDDDESSTAASAPVEGYEFIGSATTWRYTSHVEAVTIDGDVYSPLAGLIRGRVAAGTVRETPTLVVTLPVSAQVIQHYGFQTPPRTLRLKVYRQQTVSGDFIVEWDGDVTGITPRGRTAEVTCPSLLGARLGTSIPTLTVRRVCAHDLYGARCRVVRGTFLHNTTIASVSLLDPRIITVAGVGVLADQWFRAGEIVRDADGERRSIIDQVGAVIKVMAPFRTLANPDAVSMYAGCDHRIETCDSKFSNADHFGGFPVMPEFNPFRVPLRLGEGS